MADEKLNILLVDDDEDDFVITRDVLEDIEDFDYTLVWESDYDKALERICNEKQDICLIDYRLGKKDGIDLIREVHKRNQVCPPMVLLTGKGSREVDNEAMAVGAADFLVKTEMTPQLIERSIRYSLNNHKVHQLLKDGESKFRQLFQSAIDAIYITDNDHNLIDLNKSFCELLECSVDDFEGSNLKQFFQHESDFKEYVQALREDHLLKDFDVLLKPEVSGEAIWCQLSTVERINHAGEHIGYQGFIRDTTLHKRAEMELLMAEKLSMTGKIARSIAHEVRNPLTNLDLALDQLVDEIPDNEDTKMFVNIIERNSKRIGQLITEMLNSSKPKELDVASTDINELLNSTLDLVQDRLTLQGMYVERKYDESLAPIRVDAEKLKIALLNIILNAIEAMEDYKGQLTLRTWQDQRDILIEISDNGHGIDENDIDTLFDPFYTNKQGGMGLGLTSAQNIVNSHGGSITVNSQLGQGTNFTIAVPKI